MHVWSTQICYSATQIKKLKKYPSALIFLIQNPRSLFKIINTLLESEVSRAFVAIQAFKTSINCMYGRVVTTTGSLVSTPLNLWTSKNALDFPLPFVFVFVFFFIFVLNARGGKTKINKKLNHFNCTYMRIR